MENQELDRMGDVPTVVDQKVKLDTIDDRVVIEIGSDRFILTKGAGGLVVSPVDGQKLESRKGGSSCVRAMKKILIQSKNIEVSA